MTLPPAPPAPPARTGFKRPPWWVLLPGGLLALLALVAITAMLVVNVDAECDRVERIMATSADDASAVNIASRRLVIALVTHPLSARPRAEVSRMLIALAGPNESSPQAAKALESAHSFAQQALRLAPHSRDAHLAEGWCDVFERSWTAARAEAQAAAAGSSPDDPRVLLLLARVDRAEHRAAAAVVSLRKVTAARDADSTLRASAFVQLAQVYGEVGATDDAIPCWGAALALAPDAVRIRAVYVDTLIAHGYFDDALDEAGRAVAIRDNATTRGCRANAHAAKGVWWLEARRQPAQALAEFQASDADSPGDSAVWFNIAYAHFLLDAATPSAAEREAARFAIEHAARLAPDDPDIVELREKIRQRAANAPSN